MTALNLASLRVKDVVTFAKGKPPAAQPYFGKDAEIYLTPEYLRGGVGTEPIKAHKNAARVRGGETIVLWDGSNAGEVFKAKAGVLSSTMVKLQPDASFIADYFYYAMKGWEGYLKGQTSGSGIPHVDKEVIGKLDLLAFPKSEQSKIAEVLATVDQAIEQTEALIAKQQRIKTGLMQDLLTRGIDEHGQLRTEQTHDFKDSPLGRIPVEWEVVPFNHFVEKLESGVSVNADDQPCGSGQVGVLKTSAMYAGKFFPDQNKTVIHEDLQRVRVSPLKNTILISRMNTPNLVGESGFVEEDHPNLYLPDRIWMTKFRSGKEFSSRWMSFVLTSKPVRAFISLNATGTSGSMKNLPQKSLMGMLIATPTSESEFRQITKALIQSEASTNSDVEHLRKLKLIKTALMQDLLTGRKRVNDLLEPAAA